MGVSVGSIRNLEYMNQCRLLAGKSGLSNEISWFYYMEDPKYMDYLKGNEIVLITGLITREKEDALKYFISRLIEKDVAGVIINLSFYIKSIPQGVIDYCEFMGMPLFEMPAELRIVDVSQSICYAIFKNETNQYDTDVTLFGILSGNRITVKRQNRLIKAGYDPSARYRAAVFRLTNSQKLTEEEIEKAFRIIKQAIFAFEEKDSLITVDEDCLIWLINEDNNPKFRELISKVDLLIAEEKGIGDSKPFLSAKDYCIGISNSFVDLKNLKESVNNAVEVIRLGTGNNSEDRPVCYDDIIELRLFSKFEDKSELKDIYSNVLGELLNESNRELFDTLVAYIGSGCVAKKTAEKLYIHENTMTYRLKKIENLLGINIRDQNEIIKLSLVISMYNYINHCG